MAAAAMAMAVVATGNMVVRMEAVVMEMARPEWSLSRRRTSH